ncbi:hypothetical protein AXA44_48055 [Rhodococcus sp. SC4]|nr:hypothetical protein AXA44_48055 [Rhodococcus sp. SC4]
MDTASTCTRSGVSRRAGCSHVCSSTSRREREELDDYTAAWAVTQILATGNGADGNAGHCDRVPSPPCSTCRHTTEGG